MTKSPSCQPGLPVPQIPIWSCISIGYKFDPWRPHLAGLKGSASLVANIPRKPQFWVLFASTARPDWHIKLSSIILGNSLSIFCSVAGCIALLGGPLHSVQLPCGCYCLAPSVWPFPTQKITSPVTTVRHYLLCLFNVSTDLWLLFRFQFAPDNIKSHAVLSSLVWTAGKAIFENRHKSRALWFGVVFIFKLLFSCC